MAALSVPWSIALHGRAGVINGRPLSTTQAAAYRRFLSEALQLGGRDLARGARATDVVKIVVDALSREAVVGGVAVGDAMIQLDKVRISGPGGTGSTTRGGGAATEILIHGRDQEGGIGCVARDRSGDIAVATSAGLGANHQTTNCVISGTGAKFDGDRLARAIAIGLETGVKNTQAAADLAIGDQLGGLCGQGGAIILCRTGDAVWSFAAGGMPRARMSALMPTEVYLFGDEP